MRRVSGPDAMPLRRPDLAARGRLGRSPVAPVGRSALAGIGIVALALAAISLVAFPALPRQGDSIVYWRMMRWMLGEAPSPGLVQAPGYAGFLALVVGSVPLPVGPALLLVQHMLRLVPVAAMLALAWRLRMRPAVTAAAMLVAVAPESAVFAHYVMSEVLAAALVAGAAVALWRLWERPAPDRAAVVGLLVGCLTAVRPAGALGLLPGRWGGGAAPRRGSWWRGASLLAGFAAALLPWVAFNRAGTGEFALVNSIGRHLFSRVVSEGHALAPGDPALADLNREAGFPVEAPATYLWNYTEALRRKGWSEADADRRLGRVALGALARHPGRYAVGTLAGMAGIAVWTPRASVGAGPYLEAEHALGVPGSLTEAVADLRPFVPDAEAVEWILTDLHPVFDDGWPRRALAGWTEAWRGAMGILRWPLLLLVMAGAVVLWRDRSRGLPAGWGRGVVLLLVLGLLGHAAAEMPVPRYGLPYQPLVFLLACEGGAWMATIVRGRAR